MKLKDEIKIELSKRMTTRRIQGVLTLEVSSWWPETPMQIPSNTKTKKCTLGCEFIIYHKLMICNAEDTAVIRLYIVTELWYRRLFDKISKCLAWAWATSQRPTIQVIEWIWVLLHFVDDSLCIVLAILSCPFPIPSLTRAHFGGKEL